MALTNEVQVGRFSGVLHKLLAMKEGAPAPSLAPELLAAIILENDRPEWKFLGGERLAEGWTNVGAVAANFSRMQLFNPVASGALIVLERIWLTPASATGQFKLFNTATAITTLRLVQKGWRDLRGTLTEVGIAGEMREETGVAGFVGNPQLQPLVIVNQILDINVGIILPPGTGIVIESPAVNQSILANWFWRERALEPSETR